MARMVADCRDFPSESGCTLTIAGEEDEVVEAASIHAARKERSSAATAGPSIRAPESSQGTSRQGDSGVSRTSSKPV